MFRSELVPLRVLLIDDNPADVKLLRMALQDVAVPVDLTVCADGDQAVARIRSEEPPLDLVLLDLNVPCRDGLEILESLRGAECWRSIPVVVFSSAVTPADRAAIARYGATFLPKPQNYVGFVAAATEIAHAATLRVA